MDLRISQSVEDSPTTPSSYLLTIIGLPCSSLVRLNGAKFTKEGVDRSVDRLQTPSGYDVTMKTVLLIRVIERVTRAVDAMNVLDVFYSCYTVISAVSYIVNHSSAALPCRRFVSKHA